MPHYASYATLRRLFSRIVTKYHCLAACPSIILARALGSIHSLTMLTITSYLQMRDMTLATDSEILILSRSYRQQVVPVYATVILGFASAQLE